MGVSGFCPIDDLPSGFCYFRRGWHIQADGNRGIWSVENRVATADIRGRFGYMKRALLNFIEVGRRTSEALSIGRVEEAGNIATEFAPYRRLSARI